MQPNNQNTAIEKVNLLELVDDYIVPNGLIDFKTPAEMVMQYMKLVLEKPEDKELKDTLRALSDAARTVVAAGLGQNEQAKVFISLLEVNKKLHLNK